MSNCTRYLGLDVHAETITAAIAEGRGKIRSLGKFPNRPEAVRKLIDKLSGAKDLKVCYEAGPTGYALYWQLTQLGVDCEVIAPSLIPTKSGDRVKTDRRDAEKLARSYQNGDLTPVWVPTPEHEALRDLVRQRAAAKHDESRAKHRLTTLLLRHASREPGGSRAWTHPWWRWVQALKFDHEARQVTLADCIAEVLHMGERLARLDQAIDRLVETAPAHMRAVIAALQALRGVAKLTAVTVVTEVGTFQRFHRPTQMMGYTGLVPSEHSSGRRVSLACPASTVAQSPAQAIAADPASWRGRDRLEGTGASAPEIQQDDLLAQARGCGGCRRCP
jgi:transposase